LSSRYTYLTKQGIISPKLQLLSGHAKEKNLAIYRDLALADVAGKYEEAMRAFPIMMMSALCLLSQQLPSCKSKISQTEKKSLREPNENA
jgi:hypothetical protein